MHLYFINIVFLISLLFIPHIDGVVHRHDLPESAYVELANQPDFQSVCHITTTVGKTTGCLINPITVLTVAHGILPDTFILVTFFDPKTKEEVLVKGTARIHPNYKRTRENTGKVTDIVADIALITLEKPIEFLIPSPMFIDASNIFPIETITVGFGKAGDGKKGLQKNARVKIKKAFTNQISEKKAFFQSQETFALMYFFSPDKGFSTSFEGIGVEGDSGSPVFIKHGEKWYIYGITTLLSGDGKYGSFNAVLPLSSYKDWLIES